MAPATSRAMTGCWSMPRPTCCAALRATSLAWPYVSWALPATSRAAPSAWVLVSPNSSPAAPCTLPAACCTAPPTWFSSIFSSSLAVLLWLGRLDRSTAYQSVVEDQHNDRADHGHKHAVKVEAGDPGAAKGSEEPTADYRTDDPEHDVQHHAFASLVDDLAGDETSDEAQNKPPDDRHGIRSLCMHTS